MQTKTRVRVEGVDKLLKKLGKLGPGVYRPALAEAGAHLKAVLATYPPQITGRPQPFKTPRQRRFVMAAIREGLIDVPYRRTGTLGRKWTVELRDGGKTAVVGNNTGYARLVHSAEDQARFHVGGGWKTDKQVAREEAGAVKAILARHIREALN